DHQAAVAAASSAASTRASGKLFPVPQNTRRPSARVRRSSTVNWSPVFSVQITNPSSSKRDVRSINSLILGHSPHRAAGEPKVMAHTLRVMSLTDESWEQRVAIACRNAAIEIFIHF